MLMSHTRKGKSMLDGGRCFSVGRLQHADTSPSAASHLDVAVRLFFPDAEQQTNDVIVVSRRDRRAAVSARASKGGRALPSATLKAGRSVSFRSVPSSEIEDVTKRNELSVATSTEKFQLSVSFPSSSRGERGPPRKDGEAAGGRRGDLRRPEQGHQGPGAYGLRGNRGGPAER